MAELLLELFSEEIPARMQARAAEDLKRLVAEGLKKAELEYAKAEAYVTPRRLALVIDGLPLAQPDVSEERRGPRVDAPEKAIQGFLGSIGLTLEQCEQRETKKGTFWFAIIEKKGRRTAEVLAEVVNAAINALPWPKSQRWGSHATRWVRPLHSILCLFDGAVVPVSHGPVEAGRTTRGHRFLAPDAFEVTGFADYREKLLAAKVVLDAEDRKATILEKSRELAKAEGLTLKEDIGLLNEVCGLVEWPVPLVGRIDATFMDVPQEVLITSMKAHQKYFSLLNADGSLAPRFVVVANTEARDGNVQVAAGNERVLRARLSDAKFFWDQDRKVTLESRLPRLSEIVFHKAIGNLDEKVERVAALAAEIAPKVGADAAKATRAAKLAKADLVSDMVYEFPEVQGTMGRYYAINDGEDPAVADAIADHYAPQGPGDDCPSAPESVAVSLADKIDTLVSFWRIDEKPTGSKDPFALRRAALGIIRLVVENGQRLGLRDLFQAADGRITAGGDLDADDLMAFFADRLKVHLKEKGTRHDLISAVFALGGEDDLVRLLARVDALKGFVESEDGANLLTAHRRAANILRIEEKKDGVAYDGDVAANLLEQDEEKTLSAALDEAVKATAEAVSDEDFTAAMAAMSRLRQPVDSFFDQVTVNCDDADVRANRLRLLARIRAALGGVADFAKIEG